MDTFTLRLLHPRTTPHPVQNSKIHNVKWLHLLREMLYCCNSCTRPFRAIFQQRPQHSIHTPATWK